MLVFVECRSLNKEFVMLFCLLQVIDPSCFSPSLLSHFFFFYIPAARLYQLSFRRDGGEVSAH